MFLLNNKVSNLGSWRDCSVEGEERNETINFCQISSVYLLTLRKKKKEKEEKDKVSHILNLRVKWQARK